MLGVLPCCYRLGFSQWKTSSVEGLEPEIATHPVNTVKYLRHTQEKAI